MSHGTNDQLQPKILILCCLCIFIIQYTRLCSVVRLCWNNIERAAWMIANAAITAQHRHILFRISVFYLFFQQFLFGCLIFLSWSLYDSPTTRLIVVGISARRRDFFICASRDGRIPIRYETSRYFYTITKKKNGDHGRHISKTMRSDKEKQKVVCLFRSFSSDDGHNDTKKSNLISSKITRVYICKGKKHNIRSYPFQASTTHTHFGPCPAFPIR